jgi:hypothetical protein
MLFALAARDLASARIADLWAESARPDKEIEALELLRSSHPRLVGVNRRLAECYLHMDKPDLDVAIRRIEEDPPRSRSPRPPRLRRPLRPAREPARSTAHLECGHRVARVGM